MLLGSNLSQERSLHSLDNINQRRISSRLSPPASHLPIMRDLQFHFPSLTSRLPEANDLFPSPVSRLSLPEYEIASSQAPRNDKMRKNSISRFWFILRYVNSRTQHSHVFEKVIGVKQVYRDPLRMTIVNLYFV